MMTDPARVRRNDPGNPDLCPVWSFHLLYSSEDTQQWVQNGCRSADIGCIDCKKPLAESINHALDPMRIRVKELQNDIGFVRQVLSDGAEKAREEAESTLEEVRNVMGLGRIY